MRNEPSQAPSLVELLRQRAREQPEKEAYTFLVDGVEERRLTYAELDTLSRRVAARLLRSAEPGDRALLLYPPDLDFVVAFFACLYSGVVAVPTFPPGSRRALPRLLSIFRDSRPTLALTTGKSLVRLRRLSASEPQLDSLEWVVTDQQGEGPLAWTPPGVAARQLAFLQYTSGSTADPKGVMVSHASLWHNQAVIHAGFRQTESSVVVGWLPLYHDMGLIGNVLHPLYLGARCVLMSSLDFLRRPGLWLEAITRYRATVSGGPNFAYELCVRRVDDATRARLDLSSWQLAFNGAEPIRPESLERFAAAFAGSGFRRTAFYPCYGLAESTLFVTGGDIAAPPAVSRFDAAALERHRVVPAGAGSPGRAVVGCGRPWLGQEVVVVDPETRRRPLPEQVGEIWVSGPSVALGYWRNPQASEETFGARLLGEESAGPYLRTGDLGFFHDGELFVTGRLKELVILRGRNHYPQDLERTAERSHPTLRPGCGAAFSVEVDGEERLVVVHELERGAPRDFDDIVPAIRQAVAEEHQVNAYDVVLLRAGILPKTSSGKIRRRACRQSYLEGSLPWIHRDLADDSRRRAALDEEPEADLTTWDTQTPEERRVTLSLYLRQSAARCLRVPASQVDVAEPLTRHGLDSLSAMQLVEGLDRDLGLRISAERLLEGLSLRQLLDELADRQPESDADRPDSIRPAARARNLPLSYAQETFWLFDQLNPRQPVFNIPAGVHLKGPLQPAALHRSLTEVVRRHEALRTTFAFADGAPFQVISEQAHVPFQRIDLRGLGPAAGEREARRLLTSEARRPFDLARGPLLRALLVRWSEHDHHFLITMHHIVTDGWSYGNLIRELSALYTAAVTRRLVEPPRPVLHYADFAVWERQRYPESDFEAIRQRWEKGATAAPTTLRLRPPERRSARPSYRGARQYLHLEADIAARLKEFSTVRQCTLFMTLLTAYAVALSHWSREERFDVLSPVANRDLAHTPDIFGCVRNMLILRIDLTGCTSFSEALEKTKAGCLDAYAYRQVPLRTVLGRTRNRRGAPSGAPQVMFAMEQIPFEDLRLHGLRADPLDVLLGAASRDLTAYLEERGSELVLAQDYAAAFEPTTIATFLRHLETILRGVPEAVESPFADLLPGAQKPFTTEPAPGSRTACAT